MRETFNSAAAVLIFMLFGGGGGPVARIVSVVARAGERIFTVNAAKSVNIAHKATLT